MFEGLSDRLSGILSGLTRRGALTEADVRRIVRAEIANWRHDAAHSATAERRDKQHARDEASGFAVTE